MQKITPFLWFDNNAEEAMKFYTKIFKKSKILKVARYGESGPGPKGSVMSASFLLNGQEFIALNGGPRFKFTEAISLVINCKTQKEVDYFWKHLSKDGMESKCGWVKDKFGLWWQVVPEGMEKLFRSKDPEKSKRAMQAMLRMKKLDLNAMKRAYNKK
ncbi:MAG: VOC family protein [Bacteroidota bacterium]|jgi:predicted 3-demethylubiquinone-9 3-methyltransferase (glyoxalase superfamily)